MSAIIFVVRATVYSKLSKFCFQDIFVFIVEVVFHLTRVVTILEFREIVLAIECHDYNDYKLKYRLSEDVFEHFLCDDVFISVMRLSVEQNLGRGLGCQG
jgi:hypothetical protein